MKSVIEVDNISKSYQLGSISSGTLSRDIEKRWARLRGKPDPYSIVGERSNRGEAENGSEFWSLTDLNFSVNQGDSIGIIGRNGAGKSTLLKILSRITSPTTGSIKIRGRVASLLEVGTGFHPELTGRENIFLNGAILGMRRAEIKEKFDEIVEFANIGVHVDTPVKRYSSGMYVRLAFAVAANLNSEILIVDEVLAVGDAEFQKRCLGKMNDLSKGEGRTVLFVSHNMASIVSLCNSGILLNKGKLELQSNDINKVVAAYTNLDSNSPGVLKDYTNSGLKPGNEFVVLNKVRIIDNKHNTLYSPRIDQEIGVEIEFEQLADQIRISPLIVISDYTGYNGNDLFLSIVPSDLIDNHKGNKKYICWLPKNIFNNRKYFVKVDLTTFSNPVVCHASIVNEVMFEIVEDDISLRSIDYIDQYYLGAMRPTVNWALEK
jgi:lipopolysaccharide transport system ATP-binding protein